MKPELIDDESIPLARKSVLPGEGFFIPDEVETRKREAAIDEAVRDAPAVILADPDADGLACVAILGAVVGDLGLVPTDPRGLSQTLERLARRVADGTGQAEPAAVQADTSVAPVELTDVYVCDLAPDSAAAVEPALQALTAAGVTVRWYDHHKWEASIAEAVRAAGVELVRGDSESECTADVVVRTLDGTIPDRLATLAAVTRDHDLWIKSDPRSDDLADYAYWADPEEYVETVREHGPDLPDEVEAYLQDRRVEKDALIQRAVDRAAFVDVGDITVGVTYGRCSQNEVAEELRITGADAAVIVKPAGSASLRGSEGFERCHEVARLVGGGGHPRAAGCMPPIYDDMLDFSHHWVTRGAEAKRTILDAFQTVMAGPPSGESPPDGGPKS